MPYKFSHVQIANQIFLEYHISVMANEVTSANGAGDAAQATKVLTSRFKILERLFTKGGEISYTAEIHFRMQWK